MANYLELNGFKVFPRGNAKISQNQSNGVQVSELKETTDGIIVETRGTKKFDLQISPVDVSRNFTFGTTLNILDKYKRVKSVSQWSFKSNPELKSAVLSVNSLLEGKEILVEAFKNGKKVHEYVIPNQIDSQEQNWLPVAIFIVAAVAVALSNVDYEKETTVTTNPDGSKTTTVRTKKSFGGGGTISASAKANTEPVGPPIEFDHLYVTSSRAYKTEYYDELDGPIHEVVFLGNFNKIELKSITK